MIKIRNIAGEIFSQVCLASQRKRHVSAKDYTKSDVKILNNGLLVVTIRKRYDEEYNKILPIVEDNRLVKQIVEHLHQSQFGGIRVGRNIHRSAAKTVKINYNTSFGVYRNRLLNIYSLW